MSGWEAVVAGALGAIASYQSSKAAKKEAKGAHDEWERRMQYEEERAARKQNSIGGRAAPYLAEQMLRLYGEKSAGRGGFTLPIDEMLANMNIKERQSGTYNGGSYRADPFSSKGKKPNYDGGADRDLVDMLSAQMQSKSDYSKATGVQTASGFAPENDGPAVYRGSANGGASAGSLGSREETRGMGNTKTQTEVGRVQGARARYDKANGTEMELSQPDEYGSEGELATGGRFVSTGRDIPIPPDMVKKLGLATLKVGMTKLVPGWGWVANVGGKFVQKMGKSDGKQSALETMFGIKDENYGTFFGKDGIFNGFFNRNEPEPAANTRVGRGD
jgi:hypothetical protein